jgi:hypothetical protein
MGRQPRKTGSLAEWSRWSGHPLIRLRYQGPQRPAAPVADIFRRLYQDRAEPVSRLLVSSFVLTDPWRTINSAAVPFWTFFPSTPLYGPSSGICRPPRSSATSTY